MDDNEIYIPTEIPKPLWRDQWAEDIDRMGGPIVAYPVVVIAVLFALFDVVCIVISLARLLS